jgi:hypothetical protein
MLSTTTNGYMILQRLQQILQGPTQLLLLDLVITLWLLCLY